MLPTLQKNEKNLRPTAPKSLAIFNVSEQTLIPYYKSVWQLFKNRTSKENSYSVTLRYLLNVAPVSTEAEI